jgi:virulence-associated protein VagC
MTQAVNISVEERLAAVEAALAELQKQVVINPAKSDWVQQVTGSFEHEPEFEVVLAYGRAIRQGDQSVLEPVDKS